jgi:TPR repeat protein
MGPAMRRPVRAIFAVFLLAFGACGTAFGDPIADGFAAGNRGDYATALQLLRPAAEQGAPAAQFGMGQLYDEGLGIQRDRAVAADWYRKAADQGYASAETSLGLLYDLGWGVTQDDAQAVGWYRKAAVQGDPSAQLYLGEMYELGRSVTADALEAYVWCGLAASRYPEADAEHRDRAVKERDGIAAKLTAAQIADGDRQIREWAPN